MADRTALYLITRFILAQQRNPYERRLKPSALPARQAMDISASVRDQNLNLRGIPSLLENFYGFFYPRFAYPHQLANSDNVFGELRAQYSSLNYMSDGPICMSQDDFEDLWDSVGFYSYQAGTYLYSGRAAIITVVLGSVMEGAVTDHML